MRCDNCRAKVKQRRNKKGEWECIACGATSPYMGTCCTCGKDGPDVRNVMMLHFRAPVPATGWGCVVCGLPPDGAVAVLCDGCLDRVSDGEGKIVFACAGYAGENRRVKVDTLTEKFDHDLSKHEAHNGSAGSPYHG